MWDVILLIWTPLFIAGAVFIFIGVKSELREMWACCRDVFEAFKTLIGVK